LSPFKRFLCNILEEERQEGKQIMKGRALFSMNRCSGNKKGRFENLPLVFCGDFYLVILALNFSINLGTT
jgi:hypothetical protein